MPVRGPTSALLRETEQRYARVQKWHDELETFIAAVQQCAEKGPPPTDDKCPARECDARYAPDLDDSVMINSAALWPLLAPQWKDPKKWWKELATAHGKKDYDWSHLAMRYWPKRVDQKCQADPSLGVAHGCFWRYHPARAWAWEMRLQHEIGPDFRIVEAPYRDDGSHEAHRATYLADCPRRPWRQSRKKHCAGARKKKEPQAELSILEPGLWSSHPELCWQLELRIIEKQTANFHLRSPDEPEARSAYEAKHPESVEARDNLLAWVKSQMELFDKEEGEEPDVEDGEEEHEDEEGEDEE